MVSPTYHIRSIPCQAFATPDVDPLQEVLTQLVGPLQGEAQGAPVIFRRRAKTDLATEWSKLSSSRGSAEELWQTGLTLLKAEKQRLAGLSHGTVLETSHPYDAKRFSWKKEVNIDSADGLEVFFSSRNAGSRPKNVGGGLKDAEDRPHSLRNLAESLRTCTLDRSARFRIFSGGLRRVCAGRFARVEIAVPGGRADAVRALWWPGLSDKVWGTVLERSEGVAQGDRRRFSARHLGGAPGRARGGGYGARGRLALPGPRA